MNSLSNISLLKTNTIYFTQTNKSTDLITITITILAQLFIYYFHQLRITVKLYENCAKYRKQTLTISACALNKLKQHNWPGNIRELSHVIERAVLLSTTNEITALQLLLDNANNISDEVVLQPLEPAEKQLIEKAMAVTGGQVIEAAKLLDISRNALYRRLEKLAIHHAE